jgi:HAD superfamily hydrolase (TIGR01509 family)
MVIFSEFEVFLFDLDGLLVDTEPLHFAAYVELCRNHGFDLNWTLSEYCVAAHFKSQGMKDALYAAFPGLFAQEPRWEVLYVEKKKIYERMLQEGRLQLMPGAEALLMRLQDEGRKHCVVTNSPRVQIEIIKSALPVLQKIPLWLTREDYELPKPSPDGYLKAIERLDGCASRVVGFEDSMKGLKSLLSAETTGVLVCPNDHPQLTECAQLGAFHFESLSSIVDMY